MNEQVKSILVGLKFLVVDDEPDNVSVVVKLLTLLGATVSSAADGQLGLEAARQVVPDVIIADLSMPNMSGWEMLYQIRQDDALKDIPVIALTAHAMRGDRERVYEAGFNSYIPKPIDVPKFVPQLVDILRNTPTTSLHFVEPSRRIPT